MYNNFFGGPIFVTIIFFIVLLFILFAVASYIITSIALYNVAKYENRDNAWIAFVPYLNWMVIFDSLNIPRYYLLGFLTTFIPYIGSILLWIYIIYLYYLLYKFFKNYEIDTLCYFIGLFIPLVMLVPYIQLNNKVKKSTI